MARITLPIIRCVRQVWSTGVASFGCCQLLMSSPAQKAAGPQYHHPHVRPREQPLKVVEKVTHKPWRQRVKRLRAIERHDLDRPACFHDKVSVRLHAAHLNPWH
jgi:hypothetical protein